MANILAFDPGTEKTAYLILEDGKIRSFGIEDNEEIIAWLKHGLFKPKPDIVACEMVASYGMAVGKEVFETCVMIGRILQCSQPIFTRVYRKDVKMHLCGTMRSKDKDIRNALIKRWGEQGKKSDKGPTFGIISHVWSALAVATFSLDRTGR